MLAYGYEGLTKGFRRNYSGIFGGGIARMRPVLTDRDRTAGEIRIPKAETPKKGSEEAPRRQAISSHPQATHN